MWGNASELDIAIVAVSTREVAILFETHGSAWRDFIVESRISPVSCGWMAVLTTRTHVLGIIPTLL